MDLKLPYTKDYELDDDFITSLEKAPPSLSFTIALYLEEYLPDLPPNDMCTHLTAGLVYHFNEPVPFILEVMRPDKYLMVLNGEKAYDLHFNPTDKMSQSQRKYAENQYTLFKNWYQDWNK